MIQHDMLVKGVKSVEILFSLNRLKEIVVVNGHYPKRAKFSAVTVAESISEKRPVLFY